MKESSKNIKSKAIKYSKMTDEDLDALIVPYLEDLKSYVPRKMVTPGWTDEMKEIRRAAIIRLIQKGVSSYKMAQEIRERWGCTMTTAKEYVADALDYLSKFRDNPRIMKNKIEEMLEKIITEAEANGRHKEALQALDMLNKMDGNYVTKVEAEIKTEIEFDFGTTGGEAAGTGTEV